MILLLPSKDPYETEIGTQKRGGINESLKGSRLGTSQCRPLSHAEAGHSYIVGDSLLSCGLLYQDSPLLRHTTKRDAVEKTGCIGYTDRFQSVPITNKLLNMK